MPDLIATLRKWASLGEAVRQEPAAGTRPRVPRFLESFGGLITASNKWRSIELAELRDILDKSRKRLPFLGEPLEHDLGAHTWLEGAPEEDYSDRLRWVFESMTVGELARTLSIPELLDLGPDVARTPVRACREVPVDKGHPDRTGRLDLVLYRGKRADQAVVVIEVKKGKAEEAETGALPGYKEATKCWPNEGKPYLLLVTEAASDVVYGFEVRSYPRLCRNLRRLAAEWAQDNKLLVAATLLGIVAAIERNLLRFSVQAGSFTPATMLHMKCFVEGHAYE